MLSYVHDIGPAALEVFLLAGVNTVSDIIGYDIFNDTRILTALDAIKAKKPMENYYWQRLYSRCLGIVLKFQYPDALPYIPNHFMCPLTLDILRDPVIAPSGYTYERSAILDFIKKYAIDPVTRTPLTPTQLYPNNNLKDAVSRYIVSALKWV